MSAVGIGLQMNAVETQAAFDFEKVGAKDRTSSWILNCDIFSQRKSHGQLSTCPKLDLTRHVQWSAWVRAPSRQSELPPIFVADGSIFTNEERSSKWDSRQGNSTNRTLHPPLFTLQPPHFILRLPVMYSVPSSYSMSLRQGFRRRPSGQTTISRDLL